MISEVFSNLNDSLVLLYLKKTVLVFGVAQVLSRSRTTRRVLRRAGRDRDLRLEGCD